MSKTVQEIMEAYGKTLEASFAVMKKSGSSYTFVADISSEEIAESRYYFDGALYSSVMRCLELKLIGNKTSIVKKGLFLDNFNLAVTHPEGDSQKVFYGGFYVAEEPEYDAAQNVTSVIAYDELYPSMQPYALSLDWTNGITLKNYLTAILDKLGIGYDNDNLDLMANANLLITSEKFIDIENDDTESAYTYRDVLDEIAKAAGVSFAFKNSLGFKDYSDGDEYKLYAIKPAESGYVIDESNLKSVTIGAKYGPVKGVVLSREPQEDNVYYPTDLSAEETAIKLSNIELIEDENDDAYREKFIKDIVVNVLGTEYYLYELESYGIAFLNFGDIFTIKACDRENGEIGIEKSYKTIFMRTDMTVSGGINEKSKLEAPQATSTEYESASTTDKTLKKTMLKVDKQSQRITAIAKESEEKYTKFEQTVDGIKGEIVDLDNNMTAKIDATAEKAELAYSKSESVEGQIDGVTDQIENINTQVSSINSDLAGINSELDGLDEDIADKVTTEVRKETTIEYLAGQVSTKIKGEYVSQSTYDTDKDKWLLKTTYESDKTQTDQNITSALARLTTLETSKFITEEQANSLISQSADSISLSVEKNLKIGARNILLNSACFENFTAYNYAGNEALSGAYTDASMPSGKYLVATFSGYRDSDGKDGYSGSCWRNTDIIGEENDSIAKIKPNTTYTLSFWLKDGTGNATTAYSLNYKSLIYVKDGNVSYDMTRGSMTEADTANGTLPVSASWKRYTITFTTPDSISRFYLRFFFKGCAVGTGYRAFISSLKLEEGNIATDWSPSAEDVEQSVNAKIDLCVKTDEDGKLLSKIAVKSNLFTIDTDYLKLSEDGTLTNGNGSNMYLTMNKGVIDRYFNDELICEYHTTQASYWHERNNKTDYYEWIECQNGLVIGHDIKSPGEDFKWFYFDDLGLNILSYPDEAQELMTFQLTDTTTWSYQKNGTELIAPALRNMIKVNTALIISANGGANNLYLEGYVHSCGPMYLLDYKGAGTGKKALYVDLATGKITT